MTWYRDPKLISAIVFLFLILMVWLFGEYFGLASPSARFAVVFLLMLLWVVILMVGRAIRERSARLLEKVLRRDADQAVVASSPEHRADVAALRQRLLSAITTLKTSNLGKTRGKAALYEMPWYMLLGHPSAGKTCAIHNSGLKFPLAGKDGEIAIPGVGGTRNCDWFFSTEGVLLDTAGRYSTQQEDRAEWIEFLKLLKKHRPRTPLNGILVAISLTELIRPQEEVFQEYARKIRQRINEVEEIFGLKLPVYLVITKLDLLQGFNQFFEDLGEDERQQVWGATLDHDQRAGFDAVRETSEQFEALFQGLAQMGADHLAASRANQKRPALFAFPLEYHGLKASLCRFVEFLVEKDPYHTPTLLRGFYFTSALQDTSQSTSSVNRVSSMFDLTAFGFQPKELPRSRPYFLENLFRKVIFPDMYLVGQQPSPQRDRARVVALGAGLAVLALLTGCWSWSFIGNNKLLGEAQREMASAHALALSGSLADRLKALDVLQDRLDLLYQYRQNGRPWKLGLGLYHGADVEKVMRAEYFRQLSQVMLDPVKTSLEATLRGAVTGGGVPRQPAASAAAARGRRPAAVALGRRTTAPAQAPANMEGVYNALKTYLMLHDRSRMDAAHLTDQVARAWRPWLEQQAGASLSPELTRGAERTVAFFVSQIQEPDLPTIDNQADLVNQVRLRLRGEQAALSPLERIYSEIKTQGNTRYAPLTVARILDNKDLDLVGSSYALGGSFTREAWDGYIKATLDQAAKGAFKGMDWVLASPLQDVSVHGEVDDNHKRLMALYKADYIKEWQMFLQGVAVHAFGDPDRAAVALGRFGNVQTSPLKLILVRAAFETAWDNPSELSKTVDTARSSVVKMTQNLLGGRTPTPPAADLSQWGEVGGVFRGISGLVKADSGGRTPLDGYLDLLVKAKGKLATLAPAGDQGAARQMVQATLAGSGSELADAQQYLDNTLLAPMDDASRGVVRPILARPLMGACGALVPAVAQDLNQAWEHQVYPQWQSLAGKYPFADSGNEAAMADMVKFLQPGEGTLAKFVEHYLNGLVVRRGESFAVRQWGGQAVAFTPGFLNSLSRLTQASERLFQDGAVARFEVQPIPTPGLSEIELEIDGQRIIYRNGPQTWTTFAWPGQGAEGARIQASSYIGATATVQDCPGRLGFMRLLDKAAGGGAVSSSTLEWHFKAPKAFSTRGASNTSQEAEADQSVRFNFRLVSGLDPLKLSLLRHNSLPSKVSN